MSSSKIKGKDQDSGKVPVKLTHNLTVLVRPEDNTPEKIEKLKKKYAKCTGNVGLSFW